MLPKMWPKECRRRTKPNPTLGDREKAIKVINYSQHNSLLQTRAGYNSMEIVVVSQLPFSAFICLLRQSFCHRLAHSARPTVIDLETSTTVGLTN